MRGNIALLFTILVGWALWLAPAAQVQEDSGAKGGPAPESATAESHSEGVQEASGEAASQPAPTPTNTEAPTPTPTSTFTLEPTPTYTSTSTLTPTCTFTSTVTPTCTPTLTSTPSSTATSTETPTVTSTPTFTATFTPTPTSTPTPLGVVHFLDRLIDLDRLATLEEEGVTCKQFSSYDQRSKYDEAKNEYVDWDANGDAGNYLRVEPSGEAVMAEMEGPGCIFRIWSANPQGKIRFYFDGATTPSCEFDFNDLFNADKSPFPRPLVWQRRVDLGGDNPASNCYMPIPYAKSCKVTADSAQKQYYHIGYTTFSKETRVTTFRMKRTAEEEAELNRICEALKNSGVDPQPVDGMQFIEKALCLEPGQPQTLAEFNNPGTIRQLFAKLNSPERFARRKVLLQIFWDGAEKAAVEAPIGDFFGDAWEEAEYKSLPMGITADLNYCYWRMPFQKSARIVATNQGEAPADLKFKAAWSPGSPSANAAYFHARWRRDPISKDFDYPLLECTGKGRFVGAALFPDNLHGGWWGEGDEKVYVDGEKFPSTFGTGSEDYFGDAWGIRTFVNPYHGCVTKEEWNSGRAQSVYRWHIADDIPFNQSYRMTIENYTAQEKDRQKNDYSSMAYWYQAPGGENFFASVPVEERIPHGPIIPGAVDAEQILVRENLPAGVGIVTDSLLPKEAINHTAIRIAGPAGTRVQLKIPVAEYDKYTLTPVIVDSKGSSSITFMNGGKPVQEWTRLNAGENLIEAVLSGSKEESTDLSAALDAVVVQPYQNLIRNWQVAGPFPNEEGKGMDQAYPPEAPGGEETTWKPVQTADGVVELKDLTGAEPAVSYLSSVVFSSDDRQATTFFASNSPTRLWVNGKEIHSIEKNRRFGLDQDRFEVMLKRGWNTVLIKAGQTKSPAKVALRIKDPDDQLFFRARIPSPTVGPVPPLIPAPVQPMDCVVEKLKEVVHKVLATVCPDCPSECPNCQ